MNAAGGTPPSTPPSTPPRTPPKVPRPEPAPVVPSPPAVLLAAAGGALRTPVVTPAGPGESVVTFLWRDAEAEDVLLFVNRLTDERDLAASLMRREPGTGLWHLSYRMRSDWRASYSFLPHLPGEPAPWGAEDQVSIRRALDHGRPDPGNPVTNRNRDGVVQSVAELPDAPPQPWLAPRAGVLRGSVTRAEGPGGRTVWAYRPVAAADAALPLLIALDGEVWAGPQDLPTTLDNLVADGAIPPVAAVLVDSGGRERRWDDLDRAGRFEDYLAGDLLDWAHASLPVRLDRTRVVVAGQSLGGLTALRTVLAHPERVGMAISQSASLWQDDLAAEVGGRGLGGLRLHLEVGAQEWILRGPNRDLADRLRAAGAEVHHVEYNGGHDYACWRGGIADGLRHLLPGGGA